MKVEKIEEAGYDSAIEGLSYSYETDFNKAENAAKKLAFQDGGHNKFLESIIVYLRVSAPRYVWQEMDTYRLSTKQSESTMHTILRKLKNWNSEEYETSKLMFEEGSICRQQYFELLDALKEEDYDTRLVEVKKRLPEGFIQDRVWCLSYKTLRNIIIQRRGHKLPHWQIFINEVLKQVDHPELLPLL